MVKISKLYFPVIVALLFFLMTTGAYGYSSASILQETKLNQSQTITNDLLPFNDVTGHWGEPFIAEMYIRGIMKGYDDNTFRPNKPVTKLEALVMTIRAMGFVPDNKELPSKYLLSDVFHVPDWAIPYADYAIKNKMLFYNEIENMTYQQPLTRQDAAVMVVRSLGLAQEAKNNEIELNFIDADKINTDLVHYVAVASNLGIITGSPNGEFLPNNPISRAEIAVVLSRGFENQNNLEQINGSIVSLTIETQNILNVKTSTDEEQQVCLPTETLIYKNYNRVNLEQLTAGDYVKIHLKTQDDETVAALIIVESTDENQPILFEKISIEKAPNELQLLIDSYKINEGVFAFRDNGDIYLLTCRGEKPTSGYTIEINSINYVSDEDSSIAVTYRKSNPVSGKFYLPYINYPYSLVKINPIKIPEKILFKDRVTGELTEVQIDSL